MNLTAAGIPGRPASPPSFRTSQRGRKPLAASRFVRHPKSTPAELKTVAGATVADLRVEETEMSRSVVALQFFTPSRCGYVGLFF